jgi:ATP-dependent Clp protease protease subunit
LCLYNFFRSLPISLTFYNTGSVASVAAIAYLGAHERKVSAHATFMLHRAYANPQAATAIEFSRLQKGLTLDDERTKAITHKHLKLLTCSEVFIRP